MDRHPPDVEAMRPRPAEARSTTGSVVLYAPNVHTGGGYVLLRALLAAWPTQGPLRAFLDERARSWLPLPEVERVWWVEPKVVSRWKAETALNQACQAGDIVLCFHGLPPLLPNRGRVVVFQQNRNYFGRLALTEFSAWTAARLGFERLVSRLFRGRVTEYVVQTPTMARDLQLWYGENARATRPSVRVFPFADELPDSVAGGAPAAPEWDFIYIAHGDAHKNHRMLLEAWRELAAQGLKPRLALTLGERDAAIARAVDALRAQTGAEVYNLGQMPHEQVLFLYRRSRALIFPSLLESFGLPLIEARQLSLPILAPELDYVRDVCVPAQTFDPTSAHSIASAVRRFLDQPQPPLTPHSPAEFWKTLLDGDPGVRKDS